jgi:hypothetical protein
LRSRSRFAAFGALWADELDLWAEVGKAGIQLAVVVIGGAVFATILRALEAEREKRQQRSEALRLSLLRELSTAYAGLKDVRRTLRASGFGSPSGRLTAEQVEEFVAQMKALIKLQLSLERCVHEIRAQPDLLANGELLVRPISQLEQYVHGLIREWEQNGTAIARGVDASTVLRLQALQTFLAPAWTPGGFKENASAPMQLAERAIHAVQPTA